MLFVSLMALATLAVVSAQPASDFRATSFNSLQELVNPSWRQHRGRLRPFSQLSGTPIYNVRGARSVDNQQDQQEASGSEKRADCIVADEIMTCFANIKNKQEVVSCDVQEDFADSELVKYDQFTLSELRIMTTGKEQNIIKLYMYGRTDAANMVDYRQKDANTANRSIFTLHAKSDELTDRGLAILNDKCWESMVAFFKALETTAADKVTVHKETLGHQPWNEQTPVIANLRLI